MPSPAVDSDEFVLRGGRVIFERYRLERLLGRGGMGVVWLARDEKLNRAVALKFLPETLFLDPASRDELKRETRRSLELTHPNIVRIYDFVEDDEAGAISMEYVDGSTLASLRVARPTRCFEPRDLTAWVADLCRALDYAHHSALVVHRDLKPANLMVNSRQVLKVADFGISCSLQNTAAQVSAWKSSGGTLGYMSPQQLRGDLASPADDIYSVGASLYELLTSKPPFFSGDISYQVRATLAESMNSRRQQLGVAGEPVPVLWEETVAACLSKDPAGRPASAADLAARLGLAIQATPARELIPAETLTVRFSPALDAGPISSRFRAWRQSRWARPALGFAAASLLATVALVVHSRPSMVAGASSPPAIAAVLGATVAIAPAPSLPSGGIMIKTEPSGATIFAGTETAFSPAALKVVPSGSLLVRVELEGYETESLPAEVRPNEFTNLGVINLRRSTGAVELLTEPQDSVYTLLAGVRDTVIRQGHTPDSIAQLPTGPYRVRFARPGWPVEEQMFTVERQMTRRAEYRFGEGTLQVSTDPPGAEISFGGRSLGRTPLSVQLPSGKYAQVTAALESCEPASFDVTILSDHTVTLPPLVLRPHAPNLEIITDPPGIPFRLFAGAVEAPDSQPARVGASPATVEGLAAGPYRIVFDAAPWPSRSSAVAVAERGTTHFQHVFPHGFLKVESSPPGAEIFLGEDSLGETPLEIPLPPGTHSLTAEFRDRTARPRSVTLAEDQHQLVRFDFRVSENTTTRRPRRPKKPAETSTITKIGQSLKTFFSGGGKPKR